MSVQLQARDRALRADDAATGAVVLTNVLELEGNPYVRLWRGAAEGAGARMRRLEVSSVLARGSLRPSWVHLQWPEWSVAPARTTVALRGLARLMVLLLLARVRGARVMTTAHNVTSHEHRHLRLEAIMWSLLGRLTTDLHLLSLAGRDEFLAAHPTFGRAEIHEIPHGNYDPVVGDVPTRAEARRQLGLPPDARIFLTFGALRPYKGVDEVVTAFGRLDDRDARLVVAGEVLDESLLATLEAARDRDARMRLIPCFLSDESTTQLIRAADVVVLPYRRVLNSGSALLALTLGRPVLLPHTPTFADLRHRLGARWVSLFDGAITERDLATVPRHRDDERPDLSWCSWDETRDRLELLWNGR